MALDSPYTGIVDWRMVALRYGADFEEAGGAVVTDYEVTDISMVKESSAGSAEGNKTANKPSPKNRASESLCSFCLQG